MGEAEFYPKEVTAILHRRGRLLAQVSIEARVMPEPGILARTASIMAEMGVRILSLTFTSRGDRRYITAFIDMTESGHTVEELAERLAKQSFAISVRYSEAEPPGLLVDKHCFPLEVLGGELRALLIPAETLSCIFARFREKHGDIAWAIAFHEGVALGQTIAVRIRELFRGSPAALIRFLAQLYTACGWGRMKVGGIDPKTGEAVVIVVDNFEPLCYGRSSEPVCHFTRGILCGAAAAIWGGRFKVEEVACRAQGRSRCEFVVSRY